MVFRTLSRSGAYVAAAVLTASIVPASAHHSYSMFDHGVTSTITGTIRVWEMSNPHSYLWVVVQKDSDTQVWGLEGGGTAALLRAGVKKSSVEPGQKVTVAYHPLRDGRTGGELLKVTFENGQTINFGDGGRSTAPAPEAN